MKYLLQVAFELCEDDAELIETIRSEVHEAVTTFSDTVQPNIKISEIPARNSGADLVRKSDVLSTLRKIAKSASSTPSEIVVRQSYNAVLALYPVPKDQ